MAALSSKIEIAHSRGTGCGEEEERMMKLKANMAMKKLLIALDSPMGLWHWLIRGGKGKLLSPLFISCVGLLSNIISTQKNWVAC
ncbi:unnamed protein product [Linum trigynum]|uniref:Uncharacterized protein n=1 Tax=Linum trigynum TaxID=586398 RepID=A0AAV2GJP0_9ROSI